VQGGKSKFGAVGGVALLGFALANVILFMVFLNLEWILLLRVFRSKMLKRMFSSLF
jgi:hypothetical protein